MQIKKIILPIIIISSLHSSDSYYATLDNTSLESLGKVKVYTANRVLTDIDKISSVVTVITEDEIKRRGYRTLHDVLTRVVGFFPAVAGQAKERISNRGSGQGNYLLLIDGHAQNSPIESYGNANIFPTLDNVKQIEIIRGPGSTLWGNNAGAGIIHIITKSASDIDTKGNEYGSLDLTLDYELTNKRDVESAQYGKVFKDGQIMLSLTRFNSDAKSKDIYKPTGSGIKLLNKDLEPGWTSSSYSVWDHKPSYDIYLKGDYKDFMFFAKASDMTTSFPWFQSYEGDGKGDWTSIKRYIDLRYMPQLTSTIALETKLFYDNVEDIDTATLSPSQESKRGYVNRYNSQKEKTFGFEAIIKYKLDTNMLLAGIYYDNRDFSRKHVPVHDPIDIKSSNSAIFLENNYNAIENFQITLGARLDYNSQREKKNIILPRVALNYDITESMIIKYAYNTGFSRAIPTLSRLKSEETKTHDLQFLYLGNSSSAGITLFHSTMTDKIGWSGTDNAFINGGDIVSKGIELEFAHRFTENLNAYTNYSYTDSKYDEIKSWTDIMDKQGRVTGVPSHIYNIGVDYNFLKNYYININLRGFEDAVTRYTWGEDDGFQIFGHEYFVDLSLYTMQIANIKNLEGNLYIKNILDNDNPYPDAEEGGYVEGPHARQIGLRMIYRF